MDLKGIHEVSRMKSNGSCEREAPETTRDRSRKIEKFRGTRFSIEK